MTGAFFLEPLPGPVEPLWDFPPSPQSQLFHKARADQASRTDVRLGRGLEGKLPAKLPPALGMWDAAARPGLGSMKGPSRGSSSSPVHRFQERSPHGWSTGQGSPSRTNLLKTSDSFSSKVTDLSVSPSTTLPSPSDFSSFSPQSGTGSLPLPSLVMRRMSRSATTGALKPQVKQQRLSLIQQEDRADGSENTKKASQFGVEEQDPVRAWMLCTLTFLPEEELLKEPEGTKAPPKFSKRLAPLGQSLPPPREQEPLKAQEPVQEDRPEEAQPLSVTPIELVQEREEAARAQKEKEREPQLEKSGELSEPLHIKAIARDEPMVVWKVQHDIVAKDVARKKAVFQRWKMMGSDEMLKDDLYDATRQLGYSLATPEVVKSLMQEAEYDGLDVRDFQDYCSRLEAWELNEFKQIFATFSENSGGLVETKVLPRFFSAIGVVAVKKKIVEVLNVKLPAHTFAELMQAIKVYRVTEGFTEKELQKFDACWTFMADSTGRIQENQLGNFLLKFFSCRSTQIVERLQAEVLTVGKIKESIEHGPMVKGEVLTWARRFVEAEFELLLEKFRAMDADGSGGIDLDELTSLRGLGYSLQMDVIKEYRAAALQEYSHLFGEKDEECLDFDEFCNLVTALYSNHGFSQAEIAKLDEQFRFFDDDQNGELDTSEISNVLRYLGYEVSMDKLHQNVATVDSSRNGELDFVEFLGLARLYREEDIQRVKNVFDELSYWEHGIPVSSLSAAWVCLDFKEGDKELAIHHAVSKRSKKLAKQATKALGLGYWQPEEPMLDFYEFLAEYDKKKEEIVRQIRLRAGFTAEEVIFYRDIFASFETKGSGAVRLLELGDLLEAVGFPLRTASERESALQQVQKAREAAAFYGGWQYAGDAGDVTFAVFIQLLRALNSESNKTEIERAEAARLETMFSGDEIEQLRSSFHERLRLEEDYLNEQIANSPKSSAPRRETVGHSKELTKDGIQRLLRSLGVTFTSELKVLLEQKIDLLNPSGHIDIADYLRLMRWIADTNFGGVQSGRKK